MSEKKDWSIYSRHGVPVKEFFLFANAAKMFYAAHGIEQTSGKEWAANVTEELCEEWMAHNPSPQIRDEMMEWVRKTNAELEAARPEPLGAQAPPLQQAAALCGHQSDPDPHGTRHTCIIGGGHIGKHEDQEWSWFPTDWKPARKTL